MSTSELTPKPSSANHAQTTPTDDLIVVRRAAEEIAAHHWDHPFWEIAPAVWLTRNWKGALAPSHRHTEVRLLWTEEALVVRFVCRQQEPLVLCPTPQRHRKTMDLAKWDVCEIFLAPGMATPQRYFEFEASPLAQWLDVAIDEQGGTFKRDWDFNSGMTCAAHREAEQVIIALRLPWQAMGNAPRAGDIWRANLFRCVGLPPERGYIAWCPTATEYPNFHVPQAFGRLYFDVEAV